MVRRNPRACELGEFLRRKVITGGTIESIERCGDPSVLEAEHRLARVTHTLQSPPVRPEGFEVLGGETEHGRQCRSAFVLVNSFVPQERVYVRDENGSAGRPTRIGLDFLGHYVSYSLRYV